jgi:SAM-dependent methyltransferase
MSPSPASHALTFTGERFAPEVLGAIWYEHWHRYCLVQPLARGLAVLDAACGEGYGSFLLAATAREVVGIDIAAEAVAHAQARYAAPNLRFVEGSCTALPLADACIDLIVSFETIEHLAAQAQMLAEFRRVLAPGGVLVLSSPNKPVYSGTEPGGNEFHVRELTRDELAALLAAAFPRQCWYGQRVIAQSVLWAQDGEPGAPRAGTLAHLADDGVHAAAEPAPPMYFIVVCAAEGVPLPRLPALSLFDDGRQSLYRDYVRALRREKELAWEELDARKIAEDRLAEVIATVNELAGERERAAALAARVGALEDACRAADGELRAARATLSAVGADLEAANTELTAARGELARAVTELASARADTAAAQTELAAARGEATRLLAILTEIEARLAFRESWVGWLRWPFARLKAHAGAAG